MIQWLTRTTAANPHILQGQAPPRLLSGEEAVFYKRFTVRKRRQDWLLGRWTAKLLLQEMIRLEQGQIIALNEITILPDSNGAPQATVTAASISPTPTFSISISHSNGRSFCAAATLADWPLGVDIERIEPRSSSFATDFFTSREQQQLERSDHELRETLVTAIWSGKEAALKAVRQGLRSDTRAVSCLFAWERSVGDKQTPPGADGRAFSSAHSERWLPFDITWERKLGQSQPSLEGWWMVENGFIFTMAVGEGQREAISAP